MARARPHAPTPEDSEILGFGESVVESEMSDERDERQRVTSEWWSWRKRMLETLQSQEVKDAEFKFEVVNSEVWRIPARRRFEETFCLRQGFSGAEPLLATSDKALAPWGV